MKSLRFALAVALVGSAAAAGAAPARADISAGGLVLKGCADVTDTRYFDFQYQCRVAKARNGVLLKGPWCYSRSKLMGQSFMRYGAC